MRKKWQRKGRSQHAGEVRCYRGVHHDPIDLAATYLGISQGDLVNEAVREYVIHVCASGKLPEQFAASLLKTLGGSDA